jgi:urease accessory protein
VPSDSRAPAAIGREARLEMRFERRRGRTVLAHAYAEPPFRIGRCFDLDAAAYVIVVCTGAGVFAGDRLRQSISVGSGAHVVLTSQSALQVHPSAASAAASIHHDYVVEDEGELDCHWDPIIPFAGARLDQRFDLRIAESSRLYWSDALMAGRVTRGEAWQFQSLAHELSLRVRGSLVYLERYALVPACRDVEQTWAAGRARYLATAIVCHERATAETAEALQRADAAADGTPQVAVAADLVCASTIAVRMMAADGAPFAAARAACHARALSGIFRTPLRVGRK